jgi:aspartate aminotransferase
MLARRTALFATSGTASARVAAQAAAASGKEIIDLTAGEIWADLAPTLRAGAILAVERGASRYTDTVGLIELRKAIAREISADTGQLWSAEEVAVTTGAKQALFNAAMVLLNPGDEVIIPTPYWTTFPAQVHIAGGKPVFVGTRRGGGYLPLLDTLRAAITPPPARL